MSAGLLVEQVWRLGGELAVGEGGTRYSKNCALTAMRLSRIFPHRQQDRGRFR